MSTFISNFFFYCTWYSVVNFTENCIPYVECVCMCTHTHISLVFSKVDSLQKDEHANSKSLMLMNAIYYRIWPIIVKLYI